MSARLGELPNLLCVGTDEKKKSEFFAGIRQYSVHRD